MSIFEGGLGRPSFGFLAQRLLKLLCLPANVLGDRRRVYLEPCRDLLEIRIGTRGPLATDVGKKRDVEKQAHTAGRIELGDVRLNSLQNLRAAGLFRLGIATNPLGQVDPVFMRDVAGGAASDELPIGRRGLLELGQDRIADSAARSHLQTFLAFLVARLLALIGGGIGPFLRLGVMDCAGRIGAHKPFGSTVVSICHDGFAGMVAP